MSLTFLKTRHSENNTNSSKSGSGHLNPPPEHFSETRIEPPMNQDDSTSKNTTGFNAEADTVLSSIAKPMSINDSYTNTPTAGEVSSIISFLEKPRVYETGSFTINDTVGTFAASVIPRDLLNNTLFKAKLANIYSMKADIRIRITLNATPFQQGRYMLCWIPTGGSSNIGNVSSAWLTQHTYTKTQRTQLPRVEFDLACDTEATLLIPHVSCMSHFLTSTIGTARTISNLGYIQMFPYVPLSVPEGSSTCGYTIWASFENIQLAGVVIAQSGLDVYPQSPIDREQRAGNIGPISKQLSNISKSATILTGVPLLSAFASPVAWAANLASKVANVYGWSRPSVISPAQRMQQTPFAYLKNIDQPDMAVPLSIKADNQIELLPGFSGTDVDEMSIDFLKRIPAYLRESQWTTSATAGTLIDQLVMSPSNYFTSTVSGTANLYNYTPVCMLANYFSLWRGSIKITIKLVKTNFHSGRLMIVFNPREAIGGVSPIPTTFDNSQGAYREIIDIRESNEISLLIPFVQIAPWLITDNTNSEQFSGLLDIIVLDPLVAPTMVTSYITLLYEVSGGEDMEFAIPKNYQFNMALPVAPQAGGDPCQTVDTSIGGTGIKPKTDAFSRSCIGEDINSLRFLLKNPSPLFNKFDANTGYYTAILPYSFSATLCTASGSTESYSGRAFYDMCCGMYALSRGGVRLKAFKDGIFTTDERVLADITPTQTVIQYATPATVGKYPISTSAGSVTGTTAYLASFAMYSLQIPRYSGGTDVAVPQYHSFHSRANADHFTWPGHAQVWNTNTANKCIVQIESKSGSSLSVWKSGADDCNFGCFVSIPPVWYGGT